MPSKFNARRIARLIAVTVLMAAAAVAQRYSFRTYAEAEGLTDLTVNSVLQDRDGFLWVATTSGVFRFDGRHFRRYGVGDGLPASLVLSSMQTPDGRIWVDTPSGVARLEGDRFVAMETGGHVPNRCPQGMGQNRERMYVATTSGLFWRSAGGQSGIVAGTEGKAVVAVLPISGAGGGDVWYSVDGAVCAHLRNATTRCYSKDAGLPVEPWGGIATDAEGTVWVRSSKHLMVLERGASKFESRDSGLAVAARVGAISLDSRGLPMVPTEAGLARWNGLHETGKGVSIKNPWSLIGVGNGLAVPSVSWAIEDREGSIWVGMLGGGLARWLGSGEWESWTSQQGLVDDQIAAIARDARGKLLIGSAAGMNMLDGRRVVTVPIGSLASPGNHLRAIAAGEGDSVWLGTSLEGVGLLNTRTGQVRRFGASSGISITDLRTLVVDGQGAVWVGGVGGVLRGVGSGSDGSQAAWKWQRIAMPRLRSPQPFGRFAPNMWPGSASGAESSEVIFSMVEDGGGRVWFGGSLGLSYWDGQKVVRLGVAQGMPEGTVGTLTRGPDGDVWAGVNDLPDLYHAVASSKGRNGSLFTVQRFHGPTTAEGGGPVYVLGFDKAGNLWRGGSAGVDAYIQGHWVQYTRADGLAWNATSRNAFLADADGSVWIGTSHGLSHRLPVNSQTDALTERNPASIVGLQAGGRILSVADPQRIDYRSGNIAISFASPVFRHDKDIRFRYRLNGLETSWTETAEWDARYSGLTPGHYAFEVESGDWNGHWSAAPARLPFDVTGPFWTSSWFMPGGMALIAMFALAGWRIRDRAHVRRAGQLREAIGERTAELEKERQRERSRNRVLQHLISNRPIGFVLEGIVNLLRDQIDGGTAVILVRQADSWRAGAAPGCSAEWVAALQFPNAIPIEICEGPWLCRAPAGEPAWRHFISRAGALLPGAIGSVPIGGPDGAIGAILFLYTTIPGAEQWMEILASAARIAQVAIEHSRFYDDLQFQAHHDGLTGLPNRAWFTDKLGRALSSARELDKRLAVLFVDIDRFKEINDRMSHRAGDIVLSTLAKRMKSIVRTGDTVARIGGDEFNILLEDVAGSDAIGDIAAAVLGVIREPILVDGVRVDVSASIGIAVFPDDAGSPEELQREADAAMYCAKNLGRNRMQAFGARERALDGEHIDQALRQALQNNLFRVHYQPKVGVDGAFAGFEALLRLEHPKLGNVPPATFIPVAEASGLIVPIGTWVLDEVCRQIADWRDRGFGDIRVAINVSTVQISRPDFSTVVRECLRRRNVSPECVELELTESQALSGADEAREQIKNLREIGIRFSIDDFGTGYSSLSYLYRLQVDAIKLDRSFVQCIDTDEGARRVVQAMIGVAEALCLEVIAEGVETEEQRAALAAAGCRYMQGYFFSRPQPAAVFDSMLAAQPRLAEDLHRLRAAVDRESELVSI